MKFWSTAALLALASWHASTGADESAQLPHRPPGEQQQRLEPRSWDAVIGLVTSYAPEYAGANRWRLSTRPGGWVRFGRVSIASRSSFVARGADQGGGGGLRIDLSPSERFRIGLGLRHDSGRSESDSTDLRGLGDVRATVRARLSASYPLADGWRLGSALSVDALGHGGGTVADFRIGRGIALSSRTSASIGAAITLGSQRHMRAFYGVSAEQSARSGYPVYEPDGGARDVTLSAGLRHELGARWFAFGGIGATRLVRSAAASPIVRDPASWAISVGLAYRF